MSTFGERLKQERESRDVTLAEIADATRIGKRYLQALERNDFHDLPGTVFAKGYVRAYAEFIGADADALVEAYVREEQAQSEEGRISSADPLDGLRRAADRDGGMGGEPARGTPRMRVVFVVSIVAVVGLLALAGWYFLRPTPEGSAAGTPASPPPVAASPAPEPREAPPAAVPAPESPAEADAEPSVPPAVSAPKETPTRAAPIEVTAAVEDERDLEPESASTPNAPAMSVPEFGVGTGVVNRRLVGQGERFEPGSRVWFWTRVLGGRPGEQIRHVWLREDRVRATVELTVGGAHWRTYSRQTLPAGRWAVEARDAQGRVLARAEFVCGEP